jgi:spermidine synthase
LYYLHWRSWLRETGDLRGWLPLGLVLVLLVGWPVVRGGRVVWSVFVAGYTALALEVVLLLVFQTCYGVLYQGLGLLVAVFMAGMAVGAASLPWRLLGRRCSPPPARRGLGRVSLALAGFSAVLAASLSASPGWNGWPLPAPVMGWLIAGMMFGLAVLVGRQFTLACRAGESDAVRWASSLYTADFFGAFVGALVTSALSIPWLGLGPTCGVIAALNALMGWIILAGETSS